MTVIVNGEPMKVVEGSTVATLVDDLVADQGKGLAVAVDAEVVPRSAWSETRLEEGQRIELLAAIQGG